MRVLDVGCGPGRHAHALGRAGHRGRRRRHRQRFVDLATGGAPPGATFERADARALAVRRRVRRRHLAVPGRVRAGRRRAHDGDGRARRHGPGAAARRPAGACRAFSAYFQVRFLEEQRPLRRRRRACNHERTDDQGRSRARRGRRPVDHVLHAARAAPARRARRPRRSTPSGRSTPGAYAPRPPTIDTPSSCSSPDDRDRAMSRSYVPGTRCAPCPAAIRRSPIPEGQRTPLSDDDPDRYEPNPEATDCPQRRRWARSTRTGDVHPPPGRRRRPRRHVVRGRHRRHHRRGRGRPDRRGHGRQGRQGRGPARHRLQVRGRHPGPRAVDPQRRRPAARSCRWATRSRPSSSRRRTRKAAWSCPRSGPSTSGPGATSRRSRKRTASSRARSSRSSRAA